MHFTMEKFSRLRRGDFRYTNIFFLKVLVLKKFRAGDFGYTKIFVLKVLVLEFFRASGEAILGTLIYFS